jgi:hypothetical protein
MPPISSFFGRLLFNEKIRQSAPMFWFGLRDVGFIQLIYSRAVIQRTIVNSLALLVSAHTTRLLKK